MHNEPGRYDVAVVGGGIMGSSVAYFLKLLDPSISVCVIEPDPTYEFCSTLRASGGARRLFSCPENIDMSNFSIDFIRQLRQHMAVDGREAPVDWVEGCYPTFVVAAKSRTTNLLAKLAMRTYMSYSSIYESKAIPEIPEGLRRGNHQESR